jgi:NADH-quinone oxidoreductase subunit M
VDFFARHLLTLIMLLPAAGAAAVMAAPWKRAVKSTAVGVAVVNLILAVLALLIFDWRRSGTYDYASQGGVVQLAEQSGRIPIIRCQYLVGVDGLSLPPILLTCLIIALAIGADTSADPRQLSRLLLLETALLGTLFSLDFVQFWFFFAASAVIARLLFADQKLTWDRRDLIKQLPLVGIGSILLLPIAAALCIHQRTSDLIGLCAGPLRQSSQPTSIILFLLLLAIMLGRMMRPLGPLRGRGASDPSMYMVIPLISLGGAYGVLRIVFPIFPNAAIALWPLIAAGAIVWIFWHAMSALAKPDVPRVIARLVKMQTGIIILGAATMTASAINGAWITMCAAALAQAVILSLIAALGRLTPAPERASEPMTSRAAPIDGVFATVAPLSLAGLPLLGGFVGHFLVVVGIFSATRADSILLDSNVTNSDLVSTAMLVCLGLLLFAIATAFCLQRLIAGNWKLGPRRFSQVSPRHLAILSPLAILIVLLGVLPTPMFFTITGTTASAMFDSMKGRIDQSKVASRRISH